MSGMGIRPNTDRAGLALLAMLALFLQLAVPQGFMVASDHGQPAIVICTGHGPLLAQVDEHGVPIKAPKPGSVCAFAGHGGTPIATPQQAPIAVRFESIAAAEQTRAAFVVGQGLAAPPPPSQGPPAVL